MSKYGKSAVSVARSSKIYSATDNTMSIPAAPELHSETRELST